MDRTLEEAAFRAGRRRHRRLERPRARDRARRGARRARRSSSRRGTARRSTTRSREIEAFGSEALAVPADHAVQDEVAQVVEQAIDRFGRIDTYVANAMVTVMSEADDLQPDELRRVFDVNFFGMVYGFWAALPHLNESARHLPARQLRARVPRHPAAGRLLLVEGGRPHVPRVGARRAGEAPRRPSTSARPAGRDQHAAVRPLAPAHRLPAAAGAADLPARAVRAGGPPLLRAPGARAAARLGRAEAPLGPEALAARGRPRSCGGRAGTASTRASRSRSTRRTTSSSRCPGDPGAHGPLRRPRAESTLWTSLRLRRWLVGGGLAAAAAGAVSS